MKSSGRLTILLFIFSFYSLDSIADGCDWKQTMYVTSSNGINIRKSADLKSEIVAVALFWDSLKICGMGPEKYEQINGYYGGWRNVRFNGVEGYVFDAFLLKNIENENDSADFRLMFEGPAGCITRNYNPKFNWYGIYESHSKKNLTLRKVSINTDVLGGEMGVISTDIDDSRSLLIFGSNHEFKEGYLGPNPREELGHYLEIFPGTKYKIGDYWLNAIGEITGFSQECGQTIGFYRLRFSDLEPYKQKHIPINGFDFHGTCGVIGLYLYADINRDGMMDFVFKTSNYWEYQLVLYLSSGKDGTYDIKRVASCFVGHEGECP